MKTASLSGSLRGSVGKKDANQLRKDNRVPGVLYGGGEQKHLSVKELDTVSYTHLTLPTICSV